MSGISVVVLKSERLPLRKKLIESQGSGARSRKSPTFGGINGTKRQRNWGWGEMHSLFLSWDIHLFPSSDTGGPSSQDFSFRLTPLPPPWFSGLLAQTDSSSHSFPGSPAFRRQTGTSPPHIHIGQFLMFPLLPTYLPIYLRIYIPIYLPTYLLWALFPCRTLILVIWSVE